MPRYECQGTVAGLLPGGQAESAPLGVRGNVINLSGGGACVTVDRSVEPLKILPLHFGFPGVPVMLPVLVQVRWVEPSAMEQNEYQVGVRFIA
jgi:hypothetical protein